MHTTIQDIENALRSYADPIKKEILPKFFKTGKGEYGEGDLFLGVTVPNTRLVARQYKAVPFDIAKELLQSPWHECRLCALLILIEKFKKASAPERQRIFEFYLSQTERINNWDLVDLSAPQIVGEFLKDKPERDTLYRLADSMLLWEQRIAMVSTLTFIRNEEYMPTLALAEHFLTAKHDLMQKATGWMLREMGKRNKDLLVQFLDKHSRTMPRTMLRYAIEKLTDEERREYMKR